VKLIREQLHSLLRVPDTPERTALSFAVGVFLAFSPFLGLHTVLAIASAFLFRLNRFATLIGAWTNVPWLVVPYYAFATWVGVLILGTPSSATLPDVGFTELLSREFWRWLASQWRFLIPAFVGSTAICTLLSLIAYPTSLWMIRAYRGRVG
jgi:uncharacterized protein (DUF2062 family)